MRGSLVVVKRLLFCRIQSYTRGTEMWVRSCVSGRRVACKRCVHSREFQHNKMRPFGLFAV